MEFVENYLPYIALALLIGIIIVIALLPKKSMTTKEIAICATCIALSFALSYIKAPMGANGGSITFAAIIPLVIYCYFAGLLKGIFAGVIYALLQFIQDPQILNFTQVMFDYILAFSVFGLVAAMRPLRTKLKGYDLLITLGIAYVIRYFSHVIAGYYWVEEWPASFIYSLTYVPADFTIAAIVLVSLIQTKSLQRLEKMYLEKSIQPQKNNPASNNDSANAENNIQKSSNPVSESAQASRKE